MNVISVAEPKMLLAVSQWYENFDQISDKDVARLVESAAGSLRSAA